MYRKGQRFGHLVVFAATKKRNRGEIVYRMKCDCGRTTERSLYHIVYRIRRGGSAYCSLKCSLRDGWAWGFRQRASLPGVRYGTITLLKNLTPGRDGNHRWLVRCDCGRKFASFPGSLKQRHEQSNGDGPRCRECSKERLRDLRRAVSGAYQYPVEYAAFVAARRWWHGTFKAFLKSFGRAPSGRPYLDRRARHWVAHPARHHVVTWKGKTLNLAQWAKRLNLGLTHEALRLRYVKGDRPPRLFRPKEGK